MGEKQIKIYKDKLFGLVETENAKKIELQNANEQGNSKDREVADIKHASKLIEREKSEIIGWRSKLKEAKQALLNSENRKVNLDEIKEDIRLATIEYYRNNLK